MHCSPSSHDLVLLPVQTPPTHRSVKVQTLPSPSDAQLAPSWGTPLCTQLPVAASQLSSVQSVPSTQLVLVPAHVPLLQMSPVVQRSPSLQPALLNGNLQLPVAVSH